MPLRTPHTLATLTSLLLISTSALAQEDKYDKSLEAVVISKVQEKIGDIRPSIDYNQEAALVTKKVLRGAESEKNPLAPKKIWVAPKPDDGLPPVVSNQHNDIDYTFTASIDKNLTGLKGKVVWEKFDRNGKPIN